MIINKKMKDWLKVFLHNTGHFVEYNIRIIFGSKFVYFLLFAVFFFAAILLFNLLVEKRIPDEAIFYYILIIPAVSVVLYPSAYGVQTDQDIRILEVLFGIPDYRYKVWLIRLGLVFFIAFLIVFILSFICHVLIIDVRAFKMAGQLMFPTVFCGCLAFMMSTWFKNGTGAAVVLVILLVAFFILQDFFEDRSWYLYLNPFRDSGTMNQLAWDRAILRNRLYLGGLSALFLLFGLYNLQNREAFLK